MASPTDIPPPLSDRALTHGRNVMAVASVILVLSFVPDVKIGEFEVFGFNVKDDGEWSVWTLLFVVLGYYTFRFATDCAVELRGWKDAHKSHFDSGSGTYMNTVSKHARRLHTRFWLLDFAPPMAMSAVAIVVAFLKTFVLSS